MLFFSFREQIFRYDFSTKLIFTQWTTFKFQSCNIQLFELQIIRFIEELERRNPLLDPTNCYVSHDALRNSIIENTSPTFLGRIIVRVLEQKFPEKRWLRLSWNMLICFSPQYSEQYILTNAVLFGTSKSSSSSEHSKDSKHSDPSSFPLAFKNTIFTIHDDNGKSSISIPNETQTELVVFGTLISS